MITPQKLRELSMTLGMRGNAEPWSEALAEASNEIETLTFTVEALSALQVETARQTVELRNQIGQHQQFANERHEKIVRLRTLLKRYVEHVEQSEGVTFLDDGNWRAGRLTKDERDEIVALIS
jgi:hypothetical protein